MKSTQYKHLALGAGIAGAMFMGTAAAAMPAAQAEVMVHPGTVYTHPAHVSDADLAITRQLVSVLAHDHRIGMENIGVRTVNGVVHLSGRVSQPTAIYRAVELARQIVGVRAVDDHGLDT
ncbi:BON domain-containing protein [Solimonas marina]|uniref:BON domain-containing protein n=1 Tax=Solimonas marina TaxID=2714601 RepID=A0A969W7T6_9GAMM|nr:BON domain-containing protein [Solimonas marina]NKF21078.1 BON domain-containing protein [Solimonas marina]